MRSEQKPLRAGYLHGGAFCGSEYRSYARAARKRCYTRQKTTGKYRNVKKSRGLFTLDYLSFRD